MKIKQIANEVSFYLRRPRTDFIDSEGNDMIVSSLNTARLRLEQYHDFVYAQQSAWLSVAPDLGGSLSSAFLVAGTNLSSTPAHIKAVDLIYLLAAGTTAVPIWHDPKRRLAIELRETNQSAHSQISRYFSTPIPAAYHSLNTCRAYFNGTNIRLDPQPATTQTLLLDCQTWLPPYTSDLVQVISASTLSNTITLASPPPANFVIGSTILSTTVTNISSLTVSLAAPPPRDITSEESVQFVNTPSVALGVGEMVGGDYSDWMTEQAAEYLKWSAVVDCNMWAQQFVFRQSGFIAPPEKARDAAMQSVIMWDDYLWQQGLQMGGEER